jgi:5S rRNA maturation endonuclease (ribonuclease M5)
MEQSKPQSKDLTEGLYGQPAEWRGVSSSTMSFYDCLSYKDSRGQPFLTFKYPCGAKQFRYREKKEFLSYGGVESLFGMDKFNDGGDRVYIFEGALDAMSAYEVASINDRVSCAYVALQNATPSKKVFKAIKDYVMSFDKVILCCDNDDPGQAINAKLARMFAKKSYVVDFGDYKDMNEVFEASSYNKVEVKAVLKAIKKWNPDNIKSTEKDFHDLYDGADEHSFSKTGIKDFDDKVGLAEGHFTLFSAPTGAGKTELSRFLEWTLWNSGKTIAFCHLEEVKLRSLLGLVTYDLGKDYTTKNKVIEQGAEEAVKKSLTNISEGERAYLFSLPEDCDVDRVIDELRFMREAYDIDFLFLEPIQDVVNCAGDHKESVLADLAVRITKLCAETGLSVISIAHENYEGEIKYCKTLGQRASVGVRLERDRKAEDVDVKNTIHLDIIKNRPNSLEGFAGSLTFDPARFTMKPVA